MQVGRISGALTLAASLVMVLTGCPGTTRLSNPLQDGDMVEQRALDRYQPKDMNYSAIAEARKEVERRVSAMHGWGLIEHEDGPLGRYLNSVLDRLVDVSPLPDVPARIIVVDMMESPVAVAMKDGTIYIPFKLLADMNDNPDVGSEDALAFLLAHELAHILYYHFQSDAIGDVFELVLFAGEVGYSTMRSLDVKAEMVNKLESVNRKVRLARFLEETALSPAWTRKQEQEADFLGFDLMIEGGYNPEAAHDFMQLLQEYEKGAIERRNKIRMAAEERTNQHLEKGDLGGFFAEALAQAVDDAKSSLSRKHVHVKQRREMLNEYHERWADEVADAEDIDYRPLGWHAAVRDGNSDEAVAASRIRQIFDNYNSSREAVSALADGDYDEAERYVGKSLSSPTEYNPYPRVVAASHLAEMGDREGAIEHIRMALKEGPGASFRVYEKLLQYVPDGHLQILDEAERRFGAFVRLIQYRATYLEDLGRVEEAHEVRRTCYFEHAGSKDRHGCNERFELPAS